ncbi:MAG TPA: response regulator [Candidatus Omnitrophota bacterium]|nr:response regulator [Candidatus Omnitrophota bacterium]HPD84881.1 response regulator [Candidatus Omnitrophota bacterium]HRZ03739.1 response regulator [Candidatus Omnitrophota bacterium]
MAKEILLIDDEVDIAQITRARLEHAGYKVTVLNSPKEAMDTIKKMRPDLILLDIMMPYKDGYQICDEVRSDDSIKHIPIIVFTAKSIEKDFIHEVHGFYGANDYVLKPFDADELLSKIKKYIS